MRSDTTKYRFLLTSQKAWLFLTFINGKSTNAREVNCIVTTITEENPGFLFISRKNGIH
jgi:hypothetical protein